MFFWNWKKIPLVYIQAAEVSFQYSVADQRDGIVEKWGADTDMEPLRTVILLPADRLPSVIDKIREAVANNTWTVLW